MAESTIDGRPVEGGSAQPTYEVNSEILAAARALSAGISIAGGEFNTSMHQDVIASATNSSTTNLAAGNSYTFTGTSASTLGVNAIQVSLFADKNCIIKVQQSPDGTNWDLEDTRYYTANSKSYGETIQAIASYFRVIVTTMSETTTVFRLQSVLCPIVEAVPRALDAQGNLKISLQGDAFGNGPSQFTPNQELMISPRFRLIGAQFEGSTVDANFWTTSVSTGTVTQTSSNMIITSGTANGHFARLYSVRRARFVSGATNKFRCHMRLGDVGTVNVKRRWGIAYGATMPTITDGAYFELNGTTFSVVLLKNTGEVRVSSGSFNGQLGYTYAPTLNNTVWEILYSNGSVTFIIGGVPLHKITASTATWTDTMHFHIWFDVVNSGNSAAVSYYTRTANISRMGQLLTQPTSYYFAPGTTAGVNLKIGAGNLHAVVIVNAVNNTVFTLSDSITAATPVIFAWTAGASSTLPIPVDFKGIPFYTGLRLTVATQNCGATVIYE